MLRIKFLIDERECTPIHWEDIDITAAHGDEVQPVLITDEFTFVNEDARFIMAWFANHPFEGMPFVMFFTDEISPAFNEAHIIEGCIDYYDDYKIVSPVEVMVKIRRDDGLELLDDKMRSVSYGYLYEKGNITKADFIDVPVVIKKKFDALEVAFASLTLYTITNEIIKIAEKVAEDKIQAAKTVTSTPTQKPAEIIQLIAMKILRIAYYAFMLVTIYQLLKSIKQNLMPRHTKYKAMYERRLLERACEFFGLTMDCDIPEIDFTVFMPSKTDDKVAANRKAKGIPHVSDYGYQVYEFFEMILTKYYAKPLKIGNTLYIRWIGSPFWIENAGYVMPSVLTESYTFNLNEFKANRFIGFQFDSSDDYTMPNQATKLENKLNLDVTDYAEGVNFEVITDIANPVNAKYKLNKGLEEIRIPQALGARRDKLSAFETSLKIVFSSIDLVIKLFGGKTVAEKIDERRGSLVISAPSFNIAKSIVIQNGLIPANHRSLLSAERLYNQYHYFKSFKDNAALAQHKVYTDIKIPFDFRDFLQCILSGYFNTPDNKTGKFTSVKWKLNSDYAIASFWIAEKYANTDTLTETRITA
jgi:hypothetical protein